MPEIAERSRQTARPVCHHPLSENGSMNNPSVYLKNLSNIWHALFPSVPSLCDGTLSSPPGLVAIPIPFISREECSSWAGDHPRPGRPWTSTCLAISPTLPIRSSKVFREILRTQPQVQDGVSFLTDIEVREITKEALYTGLRVQFTAQVQSEKIMKVDIGFGDDLYPEAMELQYRPWFRKCHPQRSDVTPKNL